VTSTFLYFTSDEKKTILLPLLWKDFKFLDLTAQNSLKEKKKDRNLKVSFSTEIIYPFVV
jgi:hypothetical protein